MELFKDGDVLDVVLYPEDVESAVRQFICTCHPEYATNWILNPKYNLGTVLFAGTKGDEERLHKYYYCGECGFKFVLADNASENDLEIFKSFEIFHTNPTLGIPCRNELVEISKDEFLRLSE